MEVERVLLSVSAAGKYLGISPDVINRAIASGDLPAYRKPPTYRDGSRNAYRVFKDDLVGWVRSCWKPAGEVDGA